MNTLLWQPRTGNGFQDASFSFSRTIRTLTGTGGSLNARTARQYPALSATTPDPGISRSTATDAVPVPAVQSLAERVSAIKAAFGMTISQLAKVLRVERQTIYDWMDEENPRPPQAQKQERLAAIQRLAVQWNQLCQWPAGKGIATYTTVDGDTLLDLLSADALDEARLQPVMRRLSEQVKAEWQRKEERSFGEQARRRGFQPHGQSLRSVLAGYGGTVSLTHDDE